MSLDPQQNLDLARKMILGAETGAATNLLEQLLARHQRSWQKRLPLEIAWCAECDKGAPCDPFVLGAALLGLVELLDGTRFARSWRGPVEDRRF